MTEELAKQRDALVNEIQSVKQQNQEEIAKLTAAHQEALQELEARLKKEQEEEIKKGPSCIKYWKFFGMSIYLKISILKSCCITDDTDVK